MPTRTSDPLRSLCLRLAEILSPEQPGSAAEALDLARSSWPWACRLLLIGCLRERELLSTALIPSGALPGDLLDLVEAGDEGVGKRLAPLGARSERAARPSRADLERGLALLLQEPRPASLRSPDALVRAHQVWHAEARRRLFRSVLGDRRAKISGADLIPATQLVTPSWIARYLVAGVLEPGPSPLAAASDEAAQKAFPESRRPKRILDPACGTGALLLAALESTWEVRKSTWEVSKLTWEVSKLTWEVPQPSEKPPDLEGICPVELIGFDIDRTAVEVAGTTLWMRAVELGAAGSSSPAQLIWLGQGLSDDRDHLSALIERFPHVSGDHCQISAALDALTRLDQVGTLAGGACESLDPGSLAAVKAYCASEDPNLPAILDALTDRYDAVVANPPFLSNRQMGDPLRTFIKDYYTDTAADLYGCFLARTERIVAPGGRYALICPEGWTTHSAFARFRAGWLKRNTLMSYISLGQRTFSEADLLYVGLVTARREAPDQDATTAAAQLDQVAPAERPKHLRDLCLGRRTTETNLVRQRLVATLPGSTLTVHVPEGILALLASKDLPRLGDRAEVLAGIDSGDNTRFVRYSWEVAGLSPERWRPYSKGKGFRRWLARNDTLIDWASGGAEVRSHPGSTIRNEHTFFRPGLEYSYVYGGKLSCRPLPPTIRDHGCGGIFVRDPADELVILALLNTRLATYLARTLSPTLNLPVGCLQRFPFPQLSPEARRRITELAWHCLTLRAQVIEGANQVIGEVGRWDELVREAERARHAVAEELGQHEEMIETAFFEAFGLGQRERDEVLRRTETLATSCQPSQEIANQEPSGSMFERELAERLISSAVLALLGVSLPGDLEVKLPQGLTLPHDGILPLTGGSEQSTLMEGIRPVLRATLPEDDPDQLEAALGRALGRPLELWLLTRFFDAHCRRARKRPIVWQIRSSSGSKRSLPAFACLISYRDLSQDTLPLIRTRHLAPLIQRSSGRALAELEDLTRRLEQIETRGFAREGIRTEAARYRPDLNDGVRVNIAPLQRAGVLAREVLAKDDVERALATRLTRDGDDDARDRARPRRAPRRRRPE